MNRSPMNLRLRQRQPAPGHARGLSLIELMISVILGLMIVGAASSVFLVNGRTVKATDSIGQIQDSGRYAFEMMSRDIREAGGNACAKNLPVANVLENANAAGTPWWATWNNPVLGYDDGDLADSTDGTDAIELKSGGDTTLTVVSHVPASARFNLSGNTSAIQADDVLMVCDFRQAAIFQMTGPSASPTSNLVHNTGTGSIKNCSKGLGFKVPMDCSTLGTPYTYGANSIITKLSAVRWYVADNTLIRASMGNGGTVTAEPVIDGVADLQFSYLLRDGKDYIDADLIAADRWQDVTAVRVTLALAGTERVGTDGEGLRREMSHIVTLRNRNP